MYFSLNTAIFLTVLAAAMWGSWMQITKYLNGYPIVGVIFWLYSFSFLFVWAITFGIAPNLLEQSIVRTTRENYPIIIKLLVSGGMMSLGVFCNLVIIGTVGLVLSTTISGGVGILLGLATSILEEGLPEGKKIIILLTLTTLIFIMAGFLGAFASKSRDEDLNQIQEKKKITWKLIVIMLISALLTNGWSMGTATGTAADFPPVLTCAYMATGSFLSIAIVCSVVFTVKKQWKQILCIGTSKRPIILSFISAVCHYGGNMISIYSMPVISATISFLLGKSSSLWTIFWGIFHKEFSGVSKKTKGYLYSSIILYFVGIVLLTVYQFG